MPFPNEHAARLQNPAKYARFRRENDKLAPGVHVIWGITSDSKIEIQTIRLSADKFTATEAKKWLADHNFKPLSFEPASGKEGKAMAKRKEVEAIAVPSELFLTQSLQLEAKDKDDEKKLRKFTMTAYTGREMNLSGWPWPVVVDLEGLCTGSKSRPILRDHDHARIIGHTEDIAVAGRQLLVGGVISGSGPAAAEVVAAADNGFPWQASIGAKIIKAIFAKEGQMVQANGKEFSGPCYIARKTVLGEISFVALGADDATSARIAASAAKLEVTDMEWEKWVEAKGFKVAELSDAQGKSLRAMYDAELKAAAVELEPEQEPENAPDAGVQAMRVEAARIRDIEAICGAEKEISAKAIAEGWSADKAGRQCLEAQTVRAKQDSGVKNFAIGSGKAEINAPVIEAALLIGGGVKESFVEKQYGEKILTAAHGQRNMGLKAVMAAACSLEGKSAPSLMAGEGEWIRAGFSTVGLPGMLGNVANKSLLDAYQAVPSVAVQVAKRLTTNDFKTHTGYRLTGNGEMEEVGAGGEIKHGTLGEESYTYAPKTYGKMFGLTRRDFINDDLGAFMQIPQMLGRGAALKRESLFWTLVLANTSNFFHATNKNYQTGATTALSITSLQSAVQLFRDQVDADGFPINVIPKFLLVPSSLEVTAQELFKATTVNTGGSSTTAKVPNVNVFAGQYAPLATPYLNNSAITGYSATAWYLMGDPADIAAFGICYLNGNEAPVVEEVGQSPDVLGVAWRGYYDVGVCQIDHRGGVKSSGA